MIDVPVLERDAETRYEFFTRRPTSRLCHTCLLGSVIDEQNAKQMQKGASS